MVGGEHGEFELDGVGGGWGVRGPVGHGVFGEVDGVCLDRRLGPSGALGRRSGVKGGLTASFLMR